MSSSDTYYYDEGTYGPSHNHLHPRDYYPEHPHNGHHHHHDHDHRQHRLCCDKGKSFSWLGMLFCLLVVVAMMLVFAYKCDDPAAARGPAHVHAPSNESSSTEPLYCHTIWGDSSIEEPLMKALRAFHIMAPFFALLAFCMWSYTACSRKYDGRTKGVVLVFVFNMIAEIIVAAAAVVATLAVMDDVVDAREVYIYLFMGAVAFMTVSWGMSIGFFSCADENIYCCCC